MNNLNSKSSAQAADPAEMGFSPWQRLKSKRISYLTIPLLIMATITEFVILATGWKYQQVVCLPQGMGVTFFGIFLTPVFYTAIRWITGNRPLRHPEPIRAIPVPAGADGNGNGAHEKT